MSNRTTDGGVIRMLAENNLDRLYAVLGFGVTYKGVGPSLHVEFRPVVDAIEAALIESGLGGFPDVPARLNLEQIEAVTAALREIHLRSFSSAVSSGEAKPAPFKKKGLIDIRGFKFELSLSNIFKLVFALGLLVVVAFGTVRFLFPDQYCSYAFSDTEKNPPEGTFCSEHIK